MQKCFLVLSCFVTEKRDLAVGEITRQTGIERSTVHRILSSLEAEGAVEHDEFSHRWRIGLRMVTFGHVALDRLDLRRIALAQLTGMAWPSGVSIEVNTWCATDLVLVERLQGPHSAFNEIAIALAPRHTNMLHSAVAGRCILAFLDPDELAGITRQLTFDGPTPASVRSLDLLDERLALIRSRGFDRSDEELLPGVRAVGVPMFGPSGRVVASLTAVTRRMSLEGLEAECYPMIVEAADRISLSLAH